MKRKKKNLIPVKALLPVVLYIDGDASIPKIVRALQSIGLTVTFDVVKKPKRKKGSGDE